jgi:hypothetical protein
MATFTAGIVQVYRSAGHNEAMVEAQSQVRLAFQRLDTEVRYASSVSAEDTTAAGNSYVEYLNTTTGVPLCAQLRLTADGLLQHRRWVQDNPPPEFTTLATGVTGTHPFTRRPAGTDGYSFERLLISVSATGGGATRARQIDVTFTALNSSPDSADEATCADGRPTS